MKKYVYGLLLVGSLASCTKTEKVIERLPPEKATESFSTTGPDSRALILKKSSIGKAFLLLSTSKTMGKAPQWQDHPIKVISLEKYEDRMGLYELSEGNVYDNIKVNRLLQTFKILKETDSEIYIDLEKGFQTLNMSPNLEGFTTEGFDQGMQRQGADSIAQVVDSLVKSKEVTDSRVLIVQDSRVRQEMLAPLSQAKESTKEVTRDTQLKVYEYSLQTYFELVPYKRNESFQSLSLDEKLRLALFTVDTVSPGSQKTLKTTVRWDVSEGRSPIRYILSKDIPADIVPYVRQGLEYWNLVFGRQVLTVEQSNESDLLPQERSVLVRWVNWKDAGFAYAGLQANPLTGEILRGQIYLPEFWAHLADDEYMKYREDKFQDKKSFLKYSIAHTVAHEAGHVFGMRHNFSGSFAVKPSYSLLDKVRNLFKDGKTDQAITPTATSVMEYSNALDTYIAGKLMESKPLSYDKDLIEWAYLGKSEPDSVEGEFCTDDHLGKAAKESGKILGCEPGDAAGNLVLTEGATADKNIEKSLQAAIKYYLIPAIYPKAGTRVSLSPSTYFYLSPSTMTDQYRDSVFEATGEDGATFFKVWSIQDVTEVLKNEMIRPGSYELNANNLTAVLTQMFKFASEDPTYKQVFFGLDLQGQTQKNWAAGAIKRVLSDVSIRNGETSAGVKYSLTAQDLKEIEAAFNFRRVLIEKNRFLTRINLLLPPGAQQEISQWDPKTKKSVKVKFSYRRGVPKEQLAKEAFRQIFEQLKVRMDVSLQSGAVVKSFTLNENEVKDLGKHLEQHMSYFSGNLGLDVAGLRAQLEKEVQDQIVQLLLVAGASPEEINRDFAAAYQLYKFKLGADEWTWSEEQLRVLEALKELPPSI